MGKGGMPSGISSQAMGAAQSIMNISNPARRAMFKQLASALQTGGGRGFKSGFVQQAVANSTEATQAAMRGASSSLPSSMDPSIRGRVLNRIAMGGRREAGAIGPGFAQKLITAAPAAFGAATQNQVAGYNVANAGTAATLQAAATRAAGYGNAAASVAGAAGEAALKLYDAYGGGGNSDTAGAIGEKIGAAVRTPFSWYDKYFGSRATGTTDSGNI
jgi:hypothetical protein